MQDTQSQSEGWHGYYAAQTGRATRPVFDEAMALLGEAQAGDVRMAVDLGCGDGTESLALLSRGWRVLAVDQEAEAIGLLRARVPAEHAKRLETRQMGFEALDWPPCELVYAGYSLPFIAPAHCEAVLARLTAALRPGGRLAGQLFGDRDSWRVKPAMSFQTRAQALALLAPLELEVFREREEDGNSFSGPKHWHIFDVIARKPDTA